MTNIKAKVVGGFFSTTMRFGFSVMATQFLNNNTILFESMVDDQYKGLVGYAIGALIWFFRWITDKSLENKSPEVIREKLKNPVEEALKKEDENIFDTF